MSMLGILFDIEKLALPHQNLTQNCSIVSGQVIPVEHPAEAGDDNGLRITSSCHRSSIVSSRKARIFRMPRWSVRICNG